MPPYVNVSVLPCGPAPHPSPGGKATASAPPSIDPVPGRQQARRRRQIRMTSEKQDKRKPVDKETETQRDGHRDKRRETPPPRTLCHTDENLTPLDLIKLGWHGLSLLTGASPGRLFPLPSGTAIAANRRNGAGFQNASTGKYNEPDEPGELLTRFE
ncbi:unnamed protein product [Pleuronectes platessa]|uniref:Uncharacterized protein n=1 Tax=Pleuronectes platessa TaxID=8262 RepID=A0A9N7YZL4_PLEPL|nr:unnamed protein product [Pleuronectes platessa]